MKFVFCSAISGDLIYFVPIFSMSAVTEMHVKHAIKINCTNQTFSYSFQCKPYILFQFIYTSCHALLQIIMPFICNCLALSSKMLVFAYQYSKLHHTTPLSRSINCQISCPILEEQIFSAI